MKSERELLRENLERFRVARSHKTEDPAKRSPKFRRLNESYEEKKRGKRVLSEAYSKVTDLLNYAESASYLGHEGVSIGLKGVKGNIGDTVKAINSSIEKGYPLVAGEKKFDDYPLKDYVAVINSKENTVELLEMGEEFIQGGPPKGMPYDDLEEFLEGTLSGLYHELLSHLRTSNAVYTTDDIWDECDNFVEENYD